MSTFDRFMAHPGVLLLIREHLRRAMERYTELQNILRFLDSQEKWLLAFVIYRQWVDGVNRDGVGRVYMSSIWDEAKDIGCFSRNTVSAFVDGLVAYGFIRRVPHAHDRRYQELHFSDLVHRAFQFWYHTHALTLDAVDGGERAARLEADPGLVLRLHPRLVASLVRDHMWRSSPSHFDVFFNVKNGYLVMDYLIGMMEIEPGEPRGYRVGVVSRSELTRLFHIGRSTIYRLFLSMEEQGVSWTVNTPAGPELWISRNFVLLVCRWQAAKFARIDDAFRSLEDPSADPIALPEGCDIS